LPLAFLQITRRCNLQKELKQLAQSLAQTLFIHSTLYNCKANFYICLLVYHCKAKKQCIVIYTLNYAAQIFILTIILIFKQITNNKKNYNFYSKINLFINNKIHFCQQTLEPIYGTFLVKAK